MVPRRKKKHWIVGVVEGVQNAVVEADHALERFVDSLEMSSEKTVVEPAWATRWKNKHHLPMRSRDFMENWVPIEEETVDRPGPWRCLSVPVSQAQWQEEMSR